MRSISAVLEPVLAELSSSPTAKNLKHAELKALCEVEIGLFLQHQIMSGAPAVEAWTLFSGYPFAKAWGAIKSQEDERTLYIARHTLWGFRRREAWLDALHIYQSSDSMLRGYDVSNTDQPASRRNPWLAANRWERYADLLASAPPFEGTALTVAESGRYRFSLGRDEVFVTLPVVPEIGPAIGHDLEMPRRGDGSLTFRWTELQQTARDMDNVRHNHWEARLAKIHMFTPQKEGFGPDTEFTIAGIFHLLGIVGVGKHAARRPDCSHGQ